MNEIFRLYFSIILALFFALYGVWSYFHGFFIFTIKLNQIEKNKVIRTKKKWLWKLEILFYENFLYCFILVFLFNYHFILGGL